MYYHLQSSNPINYNTVKLTSEPPMGKDALLFRIKSFSTIASFIQLNADDYIQFELYDEKKKNVIITLNWGEINTNIDIDRLPAILNAKMMDAIGKFEFSYNPNHTLHILADKKNNKKFRINACTHRFKLILGLIDTPLPTEFDTSYDCQTVPITNFMNDLYIQCSLSCTNGFNYIRGVDSKEEIMYRSVCYDMHEFIVADRPLICKMNGQWIECFPYEMKNITFTLVDFWGEPIQCMAPIRITLEVVNAEKDNVDEEDSENEN